MKRKERGVTLIALVVTIVVLLILASIGIGAITSDNGVIKQSNETKQSAERESIIEKIEADLYTEKTKTGKTPSKNDLKELIKEKDFGTVNEDDSFTSKIGNYKIEFEEIEGWEEILEYKEIQYIESNGKQWIDTGIYCDNNTKLEIWYDTLNNVSGNIAILDKFGLHYLGGTYNYFYSNSGRPTSSKSITNNTKLYHRLDSTGYYIDEIKCADIKSNDKFKTAITLKLFCYDNGNNKFCSSGKLYKCKLSQNGSVVRDFIPSLDKDDKPCLYDKVEKKYYYNQGTGEFLYGE